MAPLSPVRPRRELLAALVGAAALPGVGQVTLDHALATGAPERTLRRLAMDRASKLTDAERDRARGWARRALETIEGQDHHVLLPGDPAYPRRLRTLARPPVPLFARGRLELLDEPMVAVVGTRRCTGYGREATRRIAGGLAAAGVVVVSGLAAGIDGAAHRSAGPGRTIAVLGCGLDVAYPSRHSGLQREIAREGLLLSEFLPGTAPIGSNFPRRNRIIAALTAAVVVVEAPPKSGALSTARRVLEGGGDVFAVPGPIHQETSEGANALIRDGATLVTSAREVLGGLGLPVPAEDIEADVPPLELEGQGLALWRALADEPRHVDEIAAVVGLAPHRSLASLLALEVQGHAAQLPGLRFVRC